MTGPAGAQRPDVAVEVGTIVGAWGIQGWLKVRPHAADPQALLTARAWQLAARPGAAAAQALPQQLSILAAREHGDTIVARAREVADRTAAEALKGARILVPRSSFPAAAADEFYWVDLIGLHVVNRAGEALGAITDLIDTGPHCVLRVVPEAGAQAGKERLIPFVSAYVDDVDLTQRRVVVDWGLDY